MTIYGLYVQNGNRAGFWAQHRTWKNLCVFIEGIDGKSSGPLASDPPASNVPRIEAQAFDVRSGRPLSLGAYPFNPGDRGFVPIAEPAWSHLGRPVRQRPAAVKTSLV